MFPDPARAANCFQLRELDFSAQDPVLYIPDTPAVATDHETGALQQMTLLNGTQLDQLSNSFAAHHIQADADTLLHIHASNQEHARQSYRMSVGLLVAGIIFSMFLVYYFTHTYLRNQMERCIHKSDLDVNTQQPQTNPPSTSLPNLAETEEVIGPRTSTGTLFHVLLTDSVRR